MKVNGLRSTAARALIAAALCISVLLGGAFLAVDRLHSTPSDAGKTSAEPATDEQSRDQAVGAAGRLVRDAGLRPTAAGYLLLSCQDRDNPPYQGTVYLTFAVPTDTRADTFLTTVAAALVSHGWREGLPPNGHAFGRTLSKDAVTAVIYGHDDNAKLGVLRLYGECRNMNDHRYDAWADVTAELSTTP